MDHNLLLDIWEPLIKAGDPYYNPNFDVNACDYSLGSLAPASLGYATVEDYCDSFDHLRPLATANLDLKDVQRAWMVKAIVGLVPRGGRILEIGAGEPWVADLLARLGYGVWVVDPYDGSETDLENMRCS